MKILFLFYFLLIYYYLEQQEMHAIFFCSRSFEQKRKLHFFYTVEKISYLHEYILKKI